MVVEVIVAYLRNRMSESCHFGLNRTDLPPTFSRGHLDPHLSNLVTAVHMALAVLDDQLGELLLVPHVHQLPDDALGHVSAVHVALRDEAGLVPEGLVFLKEVVEEGLGLVQGVVIREANKVAFRPLVNIVVEAVPVYELPHFPLIGQLVRADLVVTEVPAGKE